jgi:hypothetical protein
MKRYRGEQDLDHTTEMEIEWGNDYEYVVNATITWSYEGHDGIGSYEYWGSMQYDQGDPIFEINTVLYVIYNFNGEEIKLSDEEHQKIERYIYDNAEPNFG